MQMVAVTTWKDNPYIIGRPIYEPELFFGREELFQFLTDNLSQRAKVILLHGQRRIGKSSVLRQIPNFVRLEEFVFVPFDLQDQSLRPLHRVLYDLAADIVDYLALPRSKGTLLDFFRSNVKVTLPTRAELEKDPSVFDTNFLPQVYDALGGKNLVLLLDEFDVLNDYSGDAAVKHFFPYLQSIIYRQEKLFLVPVVGRRPDELLTLLSLFREAPNREIGLLDEPSAKRLITKPAEGMLEYTPDAMQALLALSSGHPYFTQLLCHTIFAHAREAQDATITRAHIDSVVDRAMESGEAGLAWFRDGLPVPERVIFSAVAELQEVALQDQRAPTPTPLSVLGAESTGGLLWTLLREYGIVPMESLRQAEAQLIDWGFLHEVKQWGFPNSSSLVGTYTYKVTIELVRRWLLKRHPLRRAIWELERLDATGHRTYEAAAAARQCSDMPEALTLYAQVLEANPNHLPALFEMAETYVEVEEFSKAVDLYTRAYRIDPIRTKEGFVRALLGHGRDLMSHGEFELAQERLRAVLALEPANELAQRQLAEAETGMHQTLAPQNPFIVGSVVPPRQFVGREREVAIIFDQLRNGGHVAVYGERRMGKTSLLRYVASAEVWRKRDLDPTRAIIVYVDGQAIGPFVPKRFWHEVLLEVNEQAGDDQELTATLTDLIRAKEISPRDLRKVLRTLERHERSLVLLVDEFEVALQTHDAYAEKDVLTFLTELRYLATSSTERASLSIVVGTRRRLNELGPRVMSDGSPWYNHFLFLPLKPFDASEYQALLAKMPTVFALSAAELPWVRRVADGYPYLLQAALALLFRLHAEDQPFDVKRATQDLAMRIEAFFAIVWVGVSDPERMLLTLIALKNLEGHTGKRLYEFSDYNMIFSQHEHELRSLEERGLLIRGGQEDRFSYALCSSLLEWWILKEIEARREDELAAQAKTFFAFLNSQRAEQLSHALQEIWQHKIAFSTIEAWGQPLQGG